MALGRRLAVDHVVHGVVRAVDACIRRFGQHAVLDDVSRLGRLAARKAPAPQHEIAVVVVGVHVRKEAAQAEHQVVRRFELQLEQTARAVAHLFEQRRTDQPGCIDADQVRIRGGDRIAVCNLEEAAWNFLRISAQRALLLEGLQQHAERALFVPVVEQTRELRIVGIGLVGIHGADGSLDGERFRKVERLARDDVDGARRAAFLQPGLRGLVDFDGAHELGRQQRVADAAADVVALAQHEPVGRADAVAVDECLGQTRARAAQADAIGFVKTAFIGARRADVHAGQAAQCIGDVVRRQLADVFGGHDLQTRIGIALHFERLLKACADAGDDDFLDGVVGSGCRRLSQRRCSLLKQGDRSRRTDQRRTSRVHISTPTPVVLSSDQLSSNIVPMERLCQALSHTNIFLRRILLLIQGVMDSGAQTLTYIGIALVVS